MAHVVRIVQQGLDPYVLLRGMGTRAGIPNPGKSLAAQVFSISGLVEVGIACSHMT
jgi:hypothetical protein